MASLEKYYLKDSKTLQEIKAKSNLFERKELATTLKTDNGRLESLQYLALDSYIMCIIERMESINVILNSIDYISSDAVKILLYFNIKDDYKEKVKSELVKRGILPNMSIPEEDIKLYAFKYALDIDDYSVMKIIFEIMNEGTQKEDAKRIYDLVHLEDFMATDSSSESLVASLFYDEAKLKGMDIVETKRHRLSNSSKKEKALNSELDHIMLCLVRALSDNNLKIDNIDRITSISRKLLLIISLDNQEDRLQAIRKINKEELLIPENISPDELKLLAIVRMIPEKNLRIKTRIELENIAKSIENDYAKLKAMELFDSVSAGIIAETLKSDDQKIELISKMDFIPSILDIIISLNNKDLQRNAIYKYLFTKVVDDSRAITFIIKGAFKLEDKELSLEVLRFVLERYPSRVLEVSEKYKEYPKVLALCQEIGETIPKVKKKK